MFLQESNQELNHDEFVTAVFDLLESAPEYELIRENVEIFADFLESTGMVEIILSEDEASKVEAAVEKYVEDANELVKKAKEEEGRIPPAGLAAKIAAGAILLGMVLGLGGLVTAMVASKHKTATAGLAAAVIGTISLLVGAFAAAIDSQRYEIMRPHMKKLGQVKSKLEKMKKDARTMSVEDKIQDVIDKIEALEEKWAHMAHDPDAEETRKDEETREEVREKYRRAREDRDRYYSRATGKGKLKK